MKRLLLAVGTAAVCAVMAGHAAGPARAGACDNDGTPYGAGYDHSGIPGVGGTISASVTNGGSSVSGTAPAENWMSGFVGVTAEGGAFVEAGVIKDVSAKWMGNSISGFPTNGWVRFIAWQQPPAAPVFHLLNTAVNGTAYPGSITHTGSGTWTAQISTNRIQNIPVSFSGLVSSSDFLVDSVNTSAPACNSMAFQFDNTSPWFISNLSPIASGPYAPRQIDGNSFTASGA